ncbi:SRPBCC family protein [Saccharopolyspora sp. TS4A08]|uniref:SRPBCC family protein n=1 Tax=Saccharopolyspora ipomoeae TaxID=3042027 RepID=A0ABT6PJV5_9PSEU|nr:SRPBCC family protein [Saccharopolyspora sp. TS4A08]MDI2027938.1 SRPBCC family protein [Saccharopolyspora sp. TS4A08]
MNPHLSMINGHPVLRLQRVLAHPPEKVWTAVTDPDGLAAWFPARVSFDRLAPGAAMRFTFEGPDAPDSGAPETGEILEVDEPKVFAFRWDSDVIRCELLPHEQGCLLVFSHTLRGPDSDRPSAARHGAGWLLCLDALQAGLDGTTAEFDMTAWFTHAENLIDLFDLATGHAEPTEHGWQLRFERDLVQPPGEVWQLLTGGEPPEPGGTAPLPATHGYGHAGPVTESTPPETLAYSWENGGEVRFALREQHPIGTRLVLTHTITDPDQRAILLAAWHTHLELLFAALHGDVRCPWPAERTERLRVRYTEELAEDGPSGAR